MIFNTKGTYASCHSGPAFTDANRCLHAPSEVVSEPKSSDASRSATRMYRTTPLRGV